jgi:ABC-2 type transport system ATP-binding protein
MLDIRRISKRFGDIQALTEVDLTVDRGQLVGFLGPNGAGKTTAMRAVMGLIALDSGEVTWEGSPVTAQTRRRFGYMPAERGMYPRMTVRDQLVYFARLAGRKAAEARVAADEWMQRLSIDQRADDEIQALSSGNQQRVQMAISLVHRPDLLILDEPFSGLDPMAVENMKSILDEQLLIGVAVLFSSHQLDLVSDISRQVVIIDGGRIVLHGDVNDLRERAHIRYATVRFHSASSWVPHDSGVEVIERGLRHVRMRMLASTEPGAVLAEASTYGTVTEFTFTPPDLSEVFLASVGRGNDTTAEVAS